MESSNRNPPPCANGCSFHSPVANSYNLCSKCYDDYLKKNLINKSIERLKIKEITGKNIDSQISDPVSESSFCIFPFARRLAPAPACAKNKNRCKSCNKKVGLIGFECRCGDVFCGSHRYPEEHACPVNYKGIGRQILVKQNPVCIADKLEWRL